MHISEIGEWVIGSAGLVIGTTALGLALALPRRMRRHLPRLLPRHPAEARRQRTPYINAHARTVHLPPEVMSAVQRISQRLADGR